jgi:alpha-beta hydrolase superfamily lysophospholipase
MDVLPTPPASRWPRRLRRIAAMTGIAGACAYGLVTLGATRIFRGILYPAPASFPAAVPPGAELLEARASDGATVRGLFFDGPAGAPVVVHFHGNGETAGHDVWIAEELRSRGLWVLLAEYRGYGISRAGPPPTEQGLYADATAMLDALEARGIPKERITLLGVSLGSGVAAEMALRGRARSAILVSPYTSILEMARRFVPWGLPLGLIVRDRFDTLSKAPRIDIPVLVVHGDSDELIPHEMGVRVSRALPRCTMLTVRGGHHGDILGVDAGATFDAIARFAAK